MPVRTENKLSTEGFMRAIKRHRLAQGLSLKDISSRLRVHVSTVGSWESGRNLPRPHMVPKLARILNIDPLELTRVISPEPPMHVPNVQHAALKN